MVEALLSIPIMIAITIILVEIGVAIFQWNLSIKALQVGARLAAVSSPILTDADYAQLEADLAVLVDGDPVPSTVVSVSCGAGAAPCDAAAFGRLIRGADGACGNGAPGTTQGICDVARFLDESNVRVTYLRAGLGYVGRPFGVVSTIRVELVDTEVQFLLLDKIIIGLNRLKIPASPVSITSEDLSSCNAGC